MKYTNPNGSEVHFPRVIKPNYDITSDGTIFTGADTDEAFEDDPLGKNAWDEFAGEMPDIAFELIHNPTIITITWAFLGEREYGGYGNSTIYLNKTTLMVHKDWIFAVLAHEGGVHALVDLLTLNPNNSMYEEAVGIAIFNTLLQSKGISNSPFKSANRFLDFSSDNAYEGNWAWNLGKLKAYFGNIFSNHSNTRYSSLDPWPTDIQTFNILHWFIVEPYLNGPGPFHR